MENCGLRYLRFVDQFIVTIIVQEHGAMLHGHPPNQAGYCASIGVEKKSKRRAASLRSWRITFHISPFTRRGPRAPRPLIYLIVPAGIANPTKISPTTRITTTQGIHFSGTGDDDPDSASCCPSGWMIWLLMASTSSGCSGLDNIRFERRSGLEFPELCGPSVALTALARRTSPRFRQHRFD